MFTLIRLIFENCPFPHQSLSVITGRTQVTSSFLLSRWIHSISSAIASCLSLDLIFCYSSSCVNSYKSCIITFIKYWMDRTGGFTIQDDGRNSLSTVIIHKWHHSLNTASVVYHYCILTFLNKECVWIWIYNLGLSFHRKYDWIVRRCRPTWI